MKNFRLFAAAFMLFAGMATTMADPIEIPTESTIDLTQGTINSNQGQIKTDGDVVSIDNMYRDDYITFELNSAAEQRYKVTFQCATKQGTASLKFEFIDTDENTVAETTVAVESTGNWSKWADYDFTVKLPEGDLTMKITFINPSSKYTINVKDIAFAAAASGDYYTLTTGVTPEDCGASISYAPQSSEYVSGTEITFTANEAGKYVFKNWTDANGNVLGTDATYTTTITSNISVIANFELTDGVITVPTTDENPFKLGWADCYPGTNGAGNTNSKSSWVEDGSNSHWDYLSNEAELTWTINNTEKTKYTIEWTYGAKNIDNTTVEFVIWDEAGTSVIMEKKNVQITTNTGNWGKYTATQSITFDEALPVGKYKFTMYFYNSTPVTADAIKEDPEATTSTINMNSLKFLDEKAAGVESISVEPVQANGASYNLAGQKVNANVKGLVITNGKKYFNK